MDLLLQSLREKISFLPNQDFTSIRLIGVVAHFLIITTNICRLPSDESSSHHIKSPLGCLRSEAPTQRDGSSASACPTQGATSSPNAVLRLTTYRHNTRRQRTAAPGQIHGGVTPV